MSDSEGEFDDGLPFEEDGAEGFDDDAGGDEGDIDDGDDVYEPVKYEKSGMDNLPWQKTAVDFSKANFSEAGFLSLEEIPAGAYEIVKLPNGGTVIKLKNNDAKEATKPAVAETQKKAKQEKEKVAKVAIAAVDGESSKKRKRDAADDAASKSGPGSVVAAAKRNPTAPHAKVAPSNRAALPLEAVQAEWGVFNLHPSLLAGIARLGFASPTPIQSSSLPASLRDYKDVIGAAETGSGKTLAYGLPILHRLMERRERLGMDAPAASSSAAGQPRRSAAFRHLPALVLAPTRELAMQVADHLSALCEGTPLRVAAIVGGLSHVKQARVLRGRPDVVVATPGRFWDLASHGTGGAAGAGGGSGKKGKKSAGVGAGGSSGASGHMGDSAVDDFLGGLHALQFLVLDEADRLAEKGHFDSLNAILAAIQAPAPEGPGAGEGGLDDAAIERSLDPAAERILRDKARREAAAVAAAKAKAAPAVAPAAPAAAEATNDSDEDGEEEEDEEEGDVDMDGEDDDEDEDDEEEAAAAAVAEPKGLRAVDAPAHYRRQTFLFSATLGLSTAQTARDSASALLAAKASQHAAAASASNAASGGGGPGVPAKMSKKAMRKAMAAARALTPVEALMARVGALGKPAVVKVDRRGATEKGEGGSDGEGGDEEGAEGSDMRSAIPSSVALPPGLRLCRLTCGPGDKDVRLYHFLLRFPARSLLFVNSIAVLRRVAGVLGALKLPVHTLHASMQQRQRMKHLERFRADAKGILVATDVAARGLDIPDVQVVLHYSLPPSTEAFVHRCGRTARAGGAGLAVAVVAAEDQRAYSRILSVLGLAATGLPEFPLDDGPYGRRLTSRVGLARRIIMDDMAANKASSAQHKLLTMAAGAGLQLDDATAAEEGLADGSAVLHGRRKAKRQRRAEGEEQEDDVMDVVEDADGELRAAAAHKAKQRSKAQAGLRRELEGLLREPLAPAGMSHRYVATVNPELLAGTGKGTGKAAAAAAVAAGRALHPLHDRVTVERPPAAAAGGGGDGGDGAPAAQPAPAARSGSALVAPRVSIAAPDIDAGGDASRSRFGGIIPVGRLASQALQAGATSSSASASAGKEARALLAARGRVTALSVPLLAKQALAKSKHKDSKRAAKNEEWKQRKGGGAGGGKGMGGGRR